MAETVIAEARLKNVQSRFTGKSRTDQTTEEAGKSDWRDDKRFMK
jgi:hypothetical protein